MPLSSAFAGCSRAYFDVHLQAGTCLDGRPHDGGLCLISDESRAGEATGLLVAPDVAPGVGVGVGADGSPVLHEGASSHVHANTGD